MRHRWNVLDYTLQNYRQGHWKMWIFNFQGGLVVYFIRHKLFYSKLKNWSVNNSTNVLAKIQVHVYFYICKRTRLFVSMALTEFTGQV